MKLIKVIVAFLTWDRALHVHHYFPVLVHSTMLLATYYYSVV